MYYPAGGMGRVRKNARWTWRELIIGVSCFSSRRPVESSYLMPGGFTERS
jgi:hypothetical protein